MVALAIGVVIVAALSQLYLDLSRSNQEMARTNSQIENARFAMQFLENDIVHAGFWGGFLPEFDDFTMPGTPTDTPVLEPDPCLAFADWDDPSDAGPPSYADYRNALLGIPIQVYQNDLSAVNECLAAIIADKVADTDVLIVRHAENCVPGVDANCAADVAGELYLQVSNCNLEIDAGDRYVLDTTSFPLREMDCDVGGVGAPAAKRKFIQTIYYVRNYAHIDADGNKDGIPTLVRSEFELSGVLAQQPAEPLVEGIERFRVEVGIDHRSQTGAAVDYTDAIDWEDPDNRVVAKNRGDGFPDLVTGQYFVHCPTLIPSCTVEQLTNVTALKLFVLARSSEASPGYSDTKSYNLGGGATIPAFNDGFKRHVFSRTVRLNNIAGRRETP